MDSDDTNKNDEFENSASSENQIKAAHDSAESELLLKIKVEQISDGEEEEGDLIQPESHEEPFTHDVNLKQPSIIKLMEIERFKCSICGLSYRTALGLYRHKCHFCSECGKFFYCESHLQIHVETFHSGQTHDCLYCGRGFKNKDTLEQHVSIHTGSYKPEVPISDNKLPEDKVPISDNKPGKEKVPINNIKPEEQLLLIVPEVSSKKPEEGVPNKKLKVPSNKPELSGYKPDVSSKKQEVSSKKPDVSSNKSELSCYKPEVSNKIKQEVSSKKPEVSSKKPEVSSNEPEEEKVPPSLDFDQEEVLEQQSFKNITIKEEIGTDSSSSRDPNHPLRCTRCKRDFKVVSRFQRHICFYICPRCGKIFKTKRHFKEHVEMHDRVSSDHICPNCGSGFSSKGSLKQHLIQEEKQNLIFNASSSSQH